MGNSITVHQPPVRQPVARDDRAFPWYIGSALVIAVLGGFALAVILPLAAALEWGWGARWRSLVQAHGHLQVLGWAGLFIAGMGFRLVPRFAGRPLRFATVTPWVLVLLLVGMLGRAWAQPALDLAGMRGLLMVSAAAELGGALLLFAALAATLGPVVRRVPPAPLVLLGATGLVVQAALGVAWLPTLTVDQPYLAPDRDSALIAIQVFGFLVPFMLGIGLKSLPVFFGRAAPGPRWTGSFAAALGAGVAMLASGRLVFSSATGTRIEQMGALVIAAAILLALSRIGAWRPATRLRPYARRTALLLQTACAWLFLAAVAMALIALRALVSGNPPPDYLSDAVRHMMLVGTISTMIAGMAQLVLPWLAMRRPRRKGARVETLALWTLFTAATLLRVSGAWLEAWTTSPVRYELMAAGGVFALAGVAIFALSVLRAARAETPV